MSSKIFKYILSFTGDTKGATSAINSIQLKLKDVAAAAGLAFGLKEVFEFGKELVNLSGEAAGVERAFYRLSDAMTLQKLRESTHNTVSDLELMKQAVKAEAFGIPIQKMGQLFEFAAARAQATGQSVDYLVDSIITGIGRKSPMILDNLGISAISLGEKLNGTSVEAASVGEVTDAVGRIAQEQLEKMGGYAETASTKIGQIGTTWENIKKQLATDENFSSAVSGIADTLKNDLQDWGDMIAVWQSDQFSGWEKFMGTLSETWGRALIKQMKAQKEAGKVVDMYNEMYANARLGADQAATATNAVTEAIVAQGNKVVAVLSLEQIQQKSIKTYADLGERIGEYNKLLDTADITNTSYIRTVYAEITALEAKKKAFEDLAKPLVVREAVPAALPTISATQVEWRKIPATATDDTNALTNANYELIDSYNQIAYAAGAAFDTMGNKIVEGLGLAEDGFEGFLGGMIQTVAKLIGMAMSNAVANAIVGGTQAAVATGPAAPFTMPAFIATAVGGVIAAFAAIPKFADGGIVSGPTIGMMGEYPGASTNPEVIAPLSKLQGMLQPVGSSMIILQPSIEYSGDRFRVFLNKTESKVAKRNGYRRF